VTTFVLTLGDDDVRRIAEAVVSRLEREPEKRWLDVEAASTYTSLSKEAIRTAAKRGRLAGHKGASGRLVFRTEDLDAFMANPE
jgi:hypothetical protein